MTHRVLVVVATYNERENLPKLLPAIEQVCPEADLLIIDDNSPDGTAEWVQGQQDQHPRWHLIVRERKLGLGTAAILAMQYAIDHGYDFLVNMDADLSHDPCYLTTILEAMAPGGEAPRDVVIGSRYVPGGGTRGWPWYRRWMSWAVNTYARRWLRLPLRDCSGGYRCFRVAKLREIDLRSVKAHGYVFHEEILWHLRRAGARFGEVPIIFSDRKFGSSKIRLQDALAAIWRIFVLGLSDRFSRRSHRP